MSDEDDKIREAIAKATHPDWASRIGAAGAEKLKGTSAEAALKSMAQRYIAFIEERQAKNKPVPIVQKYNELAYPRAKEQRELMVLQERIEAAKRQIAEQQAAMAPRDLGEVDDPAPPPPGTRDISSIQREFPATPEGEQRKQEYIERVRQAQANAKK